MAVFDEELESLAERLGGEVKGQNCICVHDDGIPDYFYKDDDNYKYVEIQVTPTPKEWGFDLELYTLYDVDDEEGICKQVSFVWDPNGDPDEFWSNVYNRIIMFWNW